MVVVTALPSQVRRVGRTTRPAQTQFSLKETVLYYHQMVVHLKGVPRPHHRKEPNHSKGCKVQWGRHSRGRTFAVADLVGEDVEWKHRAVYPEPSKVKGAEAISFSCSLNKAQSSSFWGSLAGLTNNLES